MTDTKVCPFCAEDIKNAAIVCKHCGRDLPKSRIVIDPQRHIQQPEYNEIQRNKQYLGSDVKWKDKTPVEKEAQREFLRKDLAKQNNYKKQVGKKPISWIWIIIILSALFRIVTTLEEVEVKNNLDNGILYIYCQNCPSDRAPLYDDIRYPITQIGSIAEKTRCSTNAWYESSTHKAELEAEHGGRFTNGVFYYVNCDGRIGWIEAQNTTRENPK
jgi:hypothetical protein